MYNNELADFAEFWPQIYNLTKDEKVPGKRPVSRSMPTIFVKNREVQGVFGAAGGSFIPTCMATVSSVVVFVFVYNLFTAYWFYTYFLHVLFGEEHIQLFLSSYRLDLCITLILIVNHKWFFCTPGWFRSTRCAEKPLMVDNTVDYRKLSK